MKNKKTYILIISLIGVAVMFWNVFTERGIKELKGNFREVAFKRNEQNTGPVIRIYAVTLDAENWKEMQQYGNYMPHTKYGTTQVYFFLNKGPYPEELVLNDIIRDERIKNNCIALYEKNGMSQISFKKYPFKNSP